MKPKTTLRNTLLALGLSAAFAGTSQAADPIVYDFASDLQGWAGDEPSGMAATYYWDATSGSTGGGCMVVVMDGTTTTEMDPRVTLAAPLNQNQYLSVSIHMKIDPASSTTGTLGSGGYGNLQAVFRDAGFSWDSMWYGPIYPAAANDWVTYTFVIPQPYNSAEQYLQFQLQGTAGYSGPVTNYIDRITITPIPNPWLMVPFTDNNQIGSSWDTAADAPFANPVTHAAGTNVTPAGSWAIQIFDPRGYNGWNQFAPANSFDTTRYQNIGFDVYLDGSSGTTYGGVQMVLFGNGWSGLTVVGQVPFNAGMVGKWTHFDFPGAASGITACPAFVFQGYPGSDGGTDTNGTTSFHIDNVVLWSPDVLPKFASLTPNHLPGGVSASVNGAGDQWNRNQLITPAANNSVNHFWMNQTPAAYSMTVTNFPAPADAPEFEGHFYIVNLDTLPGAYELSASPDWNAADLALFRIQNGTNGGIVATFEWKTNLPNANPPTNNTIYCALPNQSSANGTWTVAFSDNTHGSIIGPMGVVTNFTLPDFATDPNYANNFGPSTSFMDFGVFKNDSANSGINDGKSFILSSVVVTNAASEVLYSDDFPGPGLTANYAWRTSSSVYVQWQPYGIAYWLKWSLPDSGFTVQSAGSLLGPWSDAGVTYTTPDVTGTNRLGAVPAASLPAGDAAFFRLIK